MTAQTAGPRPAARPAYPRSISTDLRVQTHSPRPDGRIHGETAHANRHCPRL